MRVVLNGEPRELPDGASVVDALALLELEADARGIAVALDGEVVPRGEWPGTRLAEGERIEVVVAIQGG